MANISSNMLGKDCSRNEYWHFKEDPERIYLRTDSCKWQYLDEEQAFEQLLESLNPKGIREKKLLESLKKCKERLKLQKSKKNNDVEMSCTEKDKQECERIVFEESDVADSKNHAIWFGKKIPIRRKQRSNVSDNQEDLNIDVCKKLI